MISGFLIALFSAFWLGVLTSVSPCPLATNIAAVSYISRKGERGNAILSSFGYTLGRMLAYISISGIISFSLLSIPTISVFLQFHMPKVIGPLLIVTGMFLLEMISLPFTEIGISKDNSKMEKSGGLLIGFLFALSFCPVSAALFFGSLIPLAVENESVILMPLFYGVGTAIPVVFFAVLLTRGEIIWPMHSTKLRCLKNGSGELQA